jgi:predicted DNA-binding transcriptional regulator AlpA
MGKSGATVVPNAVPPPPDRRLAKVPELVERYGKSASFWALHRYRGTGPRWIYLGYRSIAYWLDEVDAWINGRMVDSTSDLKYLDLNPRKNPNLRRGRIGRAHRNENEDV